MKISENGKKSNIHEKKNRGGAREIHEKKNRGGAREIHEKKIVVVPEKSKCF